MNVLNKLAIKNLKLNKKRSISTVIGITLSTALICAVATMCVSFKQTLVDETIEKSGYFHLKIDNVDDSNLKVLENNIDVKDIYKVNEIGYGKYEGIANEYKPYFKLNSMDEDTFNNLKFRLTEGRFPKNENEIVISSHIRSNGKVNNKIGDKIKINIGNRMTLDDSKLYPSNPYNSEDEKLVNLKEYEFTIVGIIKRPSYDFEDFSDPGYTVITTNLNNNDNLNVFLSLKDVKDYKNSISEILGAKNYNEVDYNSGDFKFESFKVNRELLRWEALAFGISSLNVIYTVGSFVIIIIIFTSVFCIRNSFAISTTEKVKMYGMLASVGTTKKQIKKNVLFEALILGSIGISIGVICGIFGVFILFKVVNMLVGNTLFEHLNGLSFKVSILAVIFSVILSIVTIYLSAISSARKASKITPIESLRGSKDIKMTSKKLRTPKWIKKLFGMGGVIAYKNLKRSKKKYRTTVISLTVSIVIFITMNSFLTNSFGMSDMYYKDSSYDIDIVGPNNKISEFELDDILKMDNIEYSSVVYSFPNGSFLSINDKSKFVVAKDLLYDRNQDKYVMQDTEYKYMSVTLLDSVTFKKYCDKLNLDYDKVKNQGILFDITRDIKDNKEYETRVYKYNKGDNITGKLNDKEFSVKVADVTKIAPYGNENMVYSDSGILTLNVDYFKDSYDLDIASILIKSSDPDKFEEEFKKNFNGLYINNNQRYLKENRSMRLVISIFLYGFISVITLIGVTNIFNTITSNIELRQKEFAMLKSIGMTKKEFNKMVNLETIFYSSKSLIYGIILGLIGSYLMNKGFDIKIDKAMYIPIVPIIIAIIAVFVLVFVIMKYSVNKINKQNTIETIRKENV